MIKICPNLVRTFSTIKFPQKYKQSFEITRELRTCNSIKSIQQYLEKEKDKLLIHGKTEVLQFFNQYPLNYNNKQAQFLLFSQNFQDLNIYEEQLRFRCILKLYQFSPKFAYKYRDRLKQAEDRLITNLIDKQIDAVDAINTIVLKSYWSREEILDKALQSIFVGDASKYETMLSKCVSFILKRTSDLSWRKLRSYKPLHSFLCYSSYIDHNQETKMVIQVLERIASMQLHNMGYDCVPVSIGPIYDLILQQKSLDHVVLQQAFCSLGLLPTEFGYSRYRFLLNQLIQIQRNINIYPQMLPLNKMTLEEVDHLRAAYAGKWISFSNCRFYLTNPAAFPFIFHSAFMDEAYDYFVSQLKRSKQRLMSDYAGYLAFAMKLLEFYSGNPAKCAEVLGLFKTTANQQFFKDNFESILNELSLCNFFSLMVLHRDYGFFQENKHLSQLLQPALANYLYKLKEINFYQKKTFCYQLSQLLDNFVNNPNLDISTTLAIFLQTNLLIESAGISGFDDDFKAADVFRLYNSQNYEQFILTADKIFSFFQKECLAFAELYILFSHKTQRQLVRVVSKIWQSSRNFAAVGKILAYSDFTIVTDQKGQLDGKLKGILLDSIQFISKQELAVLSIGQIQRLFRFCNHFAQQVKQFSKSFLLCSIDRLQQHLVGPAINAKLLSQMLQLANKLNTPSKTLSALIQKILQKVSNQIGEEQFTLQNYWMFVQASRFLQVKYFGNTKLNRILTDKINNGCFPFKNSQIQLPLVLKIVFGRPLLLSEGGYAYLKDRIKASLLACQIFPTQLRQQVQLETSNLAKLPLSQINFLKELFEFCLKEIKIQQGAQFYFWCLELSNNLNKLNFQGAGSKYLALESLQLIPLYSIDSSLLNRILAITKDYPQLVSPYFNTKIVNALKMPNLNLTSSYIPTLEYFSELYYAMPSQLTHIFTYLLPKIENSLFLCWKEQKQNVNSDSNQAQIIQLLNKSYTYFKIVIKNSAISLRTLDIFEICVEAKKDIEKAVGENLNTRNLKLNQNLQLNHLIDTFLALQIGKKKKSQPKPLVINEKKKFFPKSNKKSKQDEEQNNSQVYIPRYLKAFPKQQNLTDFALIEPEFQRLNLKKSQTYLEKQNFYSTRFWYKGLTVKCFMKLENKNYCILFTSQKLRNNCGLIGQLHLLEVIYQKVYALETLYVDSNIMKIEFNQSHEKIKE